MSSPMSAGAQSARPWWDVAPTSQVSYLAGVDPESLSLALDPPPASGLCAVWYHPGQGMALRDHVALLLQELDRAAVALFPRWLPGAQRLSGPRHLGVAAVRALAAERAARSRNFGPFLTDLAVRSLRGSVGQGTRLPAEVRAAGLVRVIADAYGRDAATLIVVLPPGLGAADEQALVAAAEWFVQHGHVTVWLVGAALTACDRVRRVWIELPGWLAELVAETDRDDVAPPDSPTPPAAPFAGDSIITYPPVSGLPRADSPAELALERVLATHEWARDRRWNTVVECHVLAKPYRLDLFWPDEGLNVEVDGPDHRGRLKFAEDRRRDVQLQLLGHDVLRFTNEDVLSDVHAVVRRIERLLSARRAAQQITELRNDVDH